MPSDYACNICKDVLDNGVLVYQIYMCPVEAYTDCMAQTIICSDKCLKTFAKGPGKFIELQEG